MSNMDKLAKAGVDPNLFSPEEKNVVESLSQEEVDVVLRVHKKLESVASKSPESDLLTSVKAKLAAPKII